MLTFNRDPQPATISAPPTTTNAVIQQFNSELEEEWVVGEQQVTTQGARVYSRRYHEIRFNETDLIRLDMVSLGQYSRVYEADHYYRLIRPFYEDVYSSSVSNPYNMGPPSDSDFLRWQKRINTYRQEKHYRPKRVDTLVWQRPADWPSLEEGDTGSNSTEVPTQEQGTFPTTPYVLPLVNVGKRVAARVVVDPPVSHTVEILQTPDGPAQVVSGIFLLHWPIIRIKLLELLLEAPCTVTVEFWGEYLFSRFSPEINHSGESDILQHPVGSSLETRLLPPNRSGMPQNFWNNGGDTAPLVDNYWARQGSGSWTS